MYGSHFIPGAEIGKKTPQTLRTVVEKDIVVLSLHAPYYINLNAKDMDKREASVKRILDLARITSMFGGKSVVFYPGF